MGECDGVERCAIADRELAQACGISSTDGGFVRRGVARIRGWVYSVLRRLKGTDCDFCFVLMLSLIT